MENAKGKWIRFEDGLSQNALLDSKSVNINNDSYKQFHKKCVNQKLAEERRVILIFFGTILGKRKKDKHINMDVYSIEKLLIDSAMEACTLSKDGKGEFFTAAVVKCEDSDIQNAACINKKVIKKKEECAQIELAKKVLDKGNRIIDYRKISLWEKYIFIDKDIRETAKNRIQNIIMIVCGILVRYWPFIISALYYITEYLQKKILNQYKDELIIFGIIYYIIYQQCKRALKKAKEEIEKDIEYYRELDYPIIFYNGTGKTKRWMKNYIQKYMEREGKGKTKESVFYIGMVDFEIKEKIHKFIIPKGHPEWGLICLCKLVRDLADNPWGKIWLGTSMINKIKDEFVFSPSLEANEEQHKSNSQLQIFKMPKDEKKLRDEIKKKKNWHYARDPSTKYSHNTLFPIGNSVYAIRENISWNDFIEKVIELLPQIIKNNDIYADSVDYEFWLIQVDKKECKLIESLNMISSYPTWKEDLWVNIWNSIIKLIKECQNEKISELSEIVYRGKKHKLWQDFAQLKKYFENNMMEKVDKNMSVQEKLTNQKTKTLNRSNML